MTTLTGTFNTAVMGMNTESHALSLISNNIANVSTNSYKADQYHFEDALNDVDPGGKQFFGVKSNDFRNVDQQGQITTTNRTLDLAINGKGLLVTNTTADGTGAFQYTRDGALYGQAVTLPTSTNNNGLPDQGTLLTTSNGNYVYGWAANADGTFSQTNSLASLVPIQYSNNSIFAAQPTTTISLQANVSAGSTARQTVALPYIDASGTSQTLTLGLTGNNTNNYTLDGTTSSGSTLTLSQSNVTFDSVGNISDPPGGKIQITVNDPSGPQDITVDLSKTTSLADNGGIVVQQVSQDGFIAGRLQNAYFTSDGILMGSYTNQEVKPLFKLPVANFANNSGLNALQGNVYAQSENSGALTLSGLGTGPVGTQFVTGALESSTVDLSDQFSRMIITQRAYSSSAQVLKVADEMTQAARDLKR